MLPTFSAPYREELSTPELARQFFQSTYPTCWHEGHLPRDF